MKRLDPLLLLAALFASAWPVMATARILSAGRSLFDVPVYESLTLKDGRTFTVLGRITVQTNQRSELLRAMKGAAKRFDGDAVIAYRVVEQGEIPAVTSGTAAATTSLSAGETTITHTQTTPGATQVIGVGGFSLPAAEGIVIKYDKGGIPAITADTPIPVLN